MKKTKKALLAALACSAALAGAVGLAACSGDKDTHDHKWGSWTVSTQPTNEATGKATRACTGEGTCDAKATEKEATLPVLTSTDYAVTNDTATCQAAGTGTYTYNKNGVNVSFTAATPVNASNHTDTCGHNTPTPTGHSHVWSEWEIDDDAALGVAFVATRTCTGAGTCGADESLTTVTVPSPLYGDEYEYDAPVHKTDATCLVQGADTYTYKDTENNITISFDVYTGYGDHVFENNECSVCHKTIAVLSLTSVTTVEATADETIVQFTATEEGKYEVVYTDDVTGAKVIVGENSATEIPYAARLDNGQKLTLKISTPEGTDSATYKLKVVPVTELEPDYGDNENPVDPYETPSTATVTVGGGKTARLDVSGRHYGIINYTGENVITLTGSYFDYSKYDYVSVSLTLGGDNEPGSVEFGIIGREINLTVASEAATAFDAEISLLLSEENPATENLITVGEAKNFKGASYFNVLVYDLEITDEGDYNIMIGGDNAADIIVSIGTVYDPNEFNVTDPVDANDDGSYTLAAGTTYKVVISSNDMGDGLDGTVTVAKVGADITVGESFTVEIGMAWKKTYTVELEAGDYQVLIDGHAMEFNLAAAVLIGNEYEEGLGGQELIPLETKSGSNDKVVVAETAGIYYVEVYEDVTFTIVKVA